MPANTIITLRKGQASLWNSTNPVLASGEPGYDFTNNILKIGDGTSAWNSLSNHKHSSIDITNFNSSVSGLVSGIYQPILTNPVTGTGIVNHIAYWNSASGIAAGSGQLVWDSTNNRLGIGTLSPSGSLHIDNGHIYLDNSNRLYIAGSGQSKTSNYITSTSNGNLQISANGPSLVLSSQGGWVDLGWTASTYINIGQNYNAGTNNQNIRFSPAGTERVRITASGDVGIGTSTPSGQLHVVGTGIVSSRLGIGTNTPVSSLDISGGGAKIGGWSDVTPGSGSELVISNVSSASGISNTNNAGIVLQSNGNNTVYLRSNPTNLRIGNNLGDALTITHNTNNIGIGTSSPIQKLDVRGNVYTSGNIGINTPSPTGALHVVGTGLFSSITGVPANALLSVYSTVSGATVFNVEGTNGSLFSVVDNLSGSLMSVNNNAGLPVFEVFSNDSIIGGRFGQNDFVVSSSGNIGIGKALPSVKLDVVGAVAVSGAFSATTKSFKIDHPSKPNHTLEYGSLESPYHGVRLTGRGKVIKGVGVVSLPAYLKDLIHNDDSINIQLTNLYHDKILYISKIDLLNDNFLVRAKRAKSLPDLEFCWTFTGIRKDVNLVVENIK